VQDTAARRTCGFTVIEQGLYFVLGFVTAALLALLILPAFWRRAYRLSRRDIEATLPLSPAEIAAERDQLRASFAVDRLRIEQQAEAAKAARQKAMADAGAKALRISELEDRVSARDASLADRDTRIGGLERTLAAAEATISEQASAMAADRAQIAALEGSLGTLQGEHRGLGETSDQRRVQIAALETNMEALRARIGELDRDLKASRASARELTETLRARERAVRDLEKDVAVAARRLESAEEIAERRATLMTERDVAVAALESKVEALTREGRSRDDIIRAETRRADIAGRKLTEAEETARKLKDDARATAADLARTTDKLKADKQKLQADLAEARAKAAQLQRELTSLRRAPGGPVVTDVRPKSAAGRG
jgi:chromosome segregation ATPase